MTSTIRAIHAAALSFSLMLPAGGAFAKTSHHHKHHHYSRTRGTAVGAVAGAIIDHKKPLKGALIGGAIGNVVQAVRDKKQ